MSEDTSVLPQNPPILLRAERKPPSTAHVLGMLAGGGCLGLIAVVLTAGVLFIKGALDNCPPKDFPVYPSAHQTDFNYIASTDGTTSCAAGWESGTSVSQVTTFYEAQFNTGPWQLVGRDPQTGEWDFKRRGDDATSGSMRLIAAAPTRIDVQILMGQHADPSS